MHGHMFISTQTIGPPAEETAHGSVSMKTYFQYFVAGGGYVLTVFLAFIILIAEVHAICM